MRILAVETSCDETAIAIAGFSGTKKWPKILVLSNIVSSQAEVHAKYGGVVPNLAKREHQRNLVPVLIRALKRAKLANPKRKTQNYKLQLKIKKLEKILEREPELFARFKKSILPFITPHIDAISVTCGPGLAPALWVGVNFAKALAHLWDKPLIPINHMTGHLYSAFLKKSERKNNQLLVASYRLPAIALLVSGGHTELVLMRSNKKVKVIGETLDDAAGEAFDKVARILGLRYPGGPEISCEADKLLVTSYQLPNKLPRPMITSKDYNFSFSGLKTAVLYLTRDLGPKLTKKLRPQIAKEFQSAVVEVLVKKTLRAAKEYKVKTVLLGGGVAANSLLRQRLTEIIKKELPETSCQLPIASLTGDNALMIAVAAYFTGKKRAPKKVLAEPNLRL